MSDWTPIALDAPAIFGWLAQLAALFSPFDAQSRLHWTGLAGLVVLGAGAFLVERRRSRAGGAGLFAFLFPLALYRTTSSWVDIKVYLAGRAIKPLIAAVAVPFKALIMALSAALVSGWAGGVAAGEPSMAQIIAASILVAVFNDFSYYVVHRLSHEAAWLWPFHKLHHSAEVLTPITASRNHPVFDLLRALVGALMTAPISGAVFGLFGVTQFTTIFGVSVLLAVMNFTGGALRHSHVWIDFGPVLDRIFISPAQHQIHHSMAPRHHDKNYGLTLAIWDWAFGTLYIPKGREELQFGVADRAGNPEAQVHHTLKDAYLVPFSEAARVLHPRGDVPHGENA